MAQETSAANALAAEADGSLLLENQLCFALYRATRAVTGVYGEMLSARGISYTQYLVLICLFETDGLTISALGKRLSLDSGTLTPVVKRLETRGAVTRRRSSTDERKVEVWLTAEGRELEHLAATARRHVVQKLRMHEGEIAELRGTLIDVANQLLDERDAQ